MYLVTAEQMRTIDKKTIEQIGIPEIVLMENAGRAVISFLEQTFPDLQKKNITVLAGSGNNGGDGLVVARYLHEMGVAVKVFIYMEREMTSSTKANYEILSKLPVKIYWLDNDNSMHLLKVTANYSDILIDALLGTGTNREVSGRMEQMIDIANRRSCIKIAIDVPSGLNSDMGEIWGRCLKADYTVSLAQPKRGQCINKGLKYCGKLVVKDIGIPKEVYQNMGLDCAIIEDDILQPLKEPRARATHKGTYGHVLFLGGSMGMSGAVTLAASAALRTGVGLVTCGVPETIQLHVAVRVPEAMVQPISSGNFLKKELLLPILDVLRGKKAVVVGPGMGMTEEIGTLIAELLQNARCPIVIDADGLNASEQWISEIPKAKNPIILTPHPGEMARLTGKETNYIQNNRLAVAQEFAETHKVWLVLKGANTIIATPEGQLYMNVVDSPALAVAGSGDVLAGIIGSFLAQGLDPTEACCAAVYLHGCAGKEVAQRIGEVSSKAGDIIEVIPTILMR